jgi:hypothetical protein
MNEKEDEFNKDYGDNVIPFVLRATGGKEPPGSGSNWVSKFEQGTRFLAKRKNEAGSRLSDFVLMTDPKTMNAVLLGENMNTRDGGIFWRDPEIFSHDYKFYLIIEILEPKDGNDHKISTEPVVSDAKPEVIDSLHEDE